MGRESEEDQQMYGPTLSRNGHCSASIKIFHSVDLTAPKLGDIGG